MLPNFLVLGTSRGGTTFLWKVLKQHPGVYMGKNGAYTGDIHFFNKTHANSKWERGVEWYKKFFDEAGNQKAIGQKSGLYFSDFEAPKLIKEVLGENIKFIVTLRNQMETSYSSYWYQIEDIPHKTSFLEAIEMEQKDQLNLASPLCNPGFYYKHLINYLSYFDKEQFHFIIFDNIINNPLDEIKKIYKFLNVDEDFIPADYDKKVNQAIGTGSIAYKLKKSWGYIKLHYPSSYALIKKLSFAKWLRELLGKASDKTATKKGYPNISFIEWNYLSNIYYESNKKMGIFLGIDLISLWHKNPEEQPEKE